MLPEFWSQKPDDDETKRSSTRRPRQVTEIFTWIQCFASYTSVLSTRFRDCVPELMAYMVTITRVSRDFAGLAWVRYDASFRRQAAITGNKKWSQINPSLYSICFTGCAQVQSRCELCMSVAHSTKQCVLATDPDPELPARIKAVESAVVSLAAQQSSSLLARRPSSSEVCRLYNENCCRFPKCRYRNACAKCGESHPAISCTQSTGPIASPSALVSRREASRPY